MNNRTEKTARWPSPLSLNRAGAATDEIWHHVHTLRMRYGDAGHWLLEARSGISGVQLRLVGGARHYLAAHEFYRTMRGQNPMLGELEAALSLFCMDSAVECMTYTLNAIGWAIQPGGFRDITDEKQLKCISPMDILQGRMSGYCNLFPSLVTSWIEKQGLLQRIRDLHDVSKHRRIVLSGGHLGSDRIEIFLRRDPKAPPVARLPGQPVTEDDLLGTIGERFAELFNSSAEAALKDTRNIPL